MPPTLVAAPKSAFQELVQPFLQAKCIACHSTEKKKAGLSVESHGTLLQGGDNGPALVAGKSAESLIIKRLRLPLDHDDHMPPPGKPQPSPDEIALLQWWIDAGAPVDKTLADLKPPANIERNLSAASAAPAVTLPPLKLEELQKTIAPLNNALDVHIAPLAQNESWLQCNASLAGKSFGDAELGKLAALKANLRWLDLAGTGVTDAGLAHVRGMVHLTRLHLERTTVTDAGLTNLSGLRDLEYLNLYGTQIGNDGLACLKPLKRLRKLYVWQTKVTPAAAESFSAAMADQEQLQRWRNEIHALRAKIQSASVEVNVGTPLAAAKTSDAKPVNAKCPVSGKDIDPAVTTKSEGKWVAFCCANCKAQFEKEPQKFLAKLNPAPATAAEKPKQ